MIFHLELYTSTIYYQYEHQWACLLILFWDSPNMVLPHSISHPTLTFSIPWLSHDSLPVTPQCHANWLLDVLAWHSIPSNIFFRTAHLPLKDYWGLNTGPLSCWTSILPTSHTSRLPFRYWMGKISVATLFGATYKPLPLPLLSHCFL